MEYTVSATDLANIQLNEEDRVKEILRNVAVILATPKGSVPMYRSFGLDMSFLDKPMNLAKNMAVIPVREAIEEWEPRAEYKDINLFFDPSNPGKLAFTVQIEIKAGDSA
ncbi:GPW/gp25 family protein [uncultured Oscillibacter sp.]|jgi:phage baseplate assembly protein W|uniref:GPW/gp25 family protein n=1 Tax=uncultured Oscillibacter sp. TaxID=876091 RepID=UPI0025E57981|nr:GPW/gp25 family protein [uncultured Oscillibacter sp.]